MLCFTSRAPPFYSQKPTNALQFVANCTVGIHAYQSLIKNYHFEIEMLEALSQAGDINYSGTPENVGPVVKDDVLLCKIDGLPDLSIRIV